MVIGNLWMIIKTKVGVNMLRKRTSSSIINLIAFVLLTVLVTAYIYFFILYSNGINLQRDAGIIPNKPNLTIPDIKHYLIACLFLSLVIHGFCLFFIKTCQSIIKQKDKIILQQQAELERRKKELEVIKKRLKKIEEKDRNKTELFSSISHELKTPISIILGAVQLIEQNKPAHIPEERRASKHFMAIKHNCYRLLRLINNILDITRIDCSSVNINPVNCNIVCLIEEITQSVVPYARNKDITLEFDTEHEEIYTSVDIDKMERIILNLLSNAIKFTPPQGAIKVVVGMVNAYRIYISIKDTGPGIPKNMQSIIFERFKQVNSSLTREFEGSGIGLSLVKSFVSLNKGNIRLISEENKGSEFIIELPINTCEYNQTDRTFINPQNKIVEAINIEFSDIYSV
jgi:signal transduction histidine kinase